MPFKKFWNLAPDNSDSSILNMYVYGQICSASSFFGSQDDVVASNFVEDLNSFPNIRTINVYINSPGGSVFAAASIINQLRKHPAQVHTWCDGICASAAVGILMAAILFMKRMSDVTEVEGWKYLDEDDDPDSLSLREVPKNTHVYEISGPMFFAAADKILNITLDDKDNCLILRMRSVSAIDATAMHSLEELQEKCEKKKITLILSHVNEQPMKVMQKAGFDKKVGAENMCVHIDDALKRAEELQM